ncbi:DUF520 family protein [candidate division KSB1 bacterium]|nr:DUF520 family protein [candidate division KSB1 bacterium]
MRPRGNTRFILTYRVSGKKRDDLQKVMAMLKDAKLDIPLQFVNYRN